MLKNWLGTQLKQTLNYRQLPYLIDAYLTYIPANIYLFKVNDKNTRKICEIYSELTMKTRERS